MALDGIIHPKISAFLQRLMFSNFCRVGTAYCSLKPLFLHYGQCPTPDDKHVVCSLRVPASFETRSPQSIKRSFFLKKLMFS